MGASNAALKACGLSQRWRNAVDLLSGLRRCGCRRSEVTVAAFVGCGGPWRQLLLVAAGGAAAARQRAWRQALQLLGGEPEALGSALEAGLVCGKAWPGKLCEEGRAGR